MATNSHKLDPRKTSRFLKGKNPRETIIIGAGLSKAFGLPLADELLSKMIQWHASRPTSGAIEPILEFIEFFYPGFAPRTGQFPAAEDVMGMLDSAEEYSGLRQSDNRGFRWRGDKVPQLRFRFNKLLAQYLWSFQTDFEKVGYAPLDRLRRFVRQRGARVAYVTFNYDLLLETALSLEGMPYSYRLDPSGQTITVLKPHGSINWFIRSPSKIFSSTLWTEFGPSISIFNELELSALPFSDDRWKQVALVAPTPHKQIELLEMRKTWTSFSSAVMGTRRLTAIGYSMPDADRMARLVIGRAGPRFSQSRRITVINPADLRATYGRYVSPNCVFVLKKFEDYVP
jgi:hypothetical protein